MKRQHVTALRLDAVDGPVRFTFITPPLHPPFEFHFPTSISTLPPLDSRLDSSLIDSGGFRDQVKVYPNPHYIGRNYSLYPFSNPNNFPPWGNAPDSLPRQVTGGRTKANDGGLVVDRSSHSRPTLNLSK